MDTFPKIMKKDSRKIPHSAAEWGMMIFSFCCTKFALGKFSTAKLAFRQIL